MARDRGFRPWVGATRPSSETKGSAPVITVAYVVHTFDTGGLERCVTRLVNHLDSSRFHPLVVCLNRTGGARRWIERDGVPVVELHKRPGNDPWLPLRLARVLEGHGVSIAHSHNWGTLLETAIAARLEPSVRHVHAERGTVLGGLVISRARRWLRSSLMRQALRRAGAVVAVSESVRQRIAAGCSLPAARVRVIPNGVDLPELGTPDRTRQELRRSLGLGGDDFLLGSIGRLAAVKGFDTAVAALERLVRRGHPVHLAVVGDGPERTGLLEQAAACGVRDRLHLPGEQDNVAAWLAAMDLYVNSSLSEGMSQSLLEAMAAGLPLVVTPAGESPAVVGGPEPCGIVVPPGDPEALATAAEAIIRDQAARELLGSRARATHERSHSVRVMVSRYQELYEEVCR